MLALLLALSATVVPAQEPGVAGGAVRADGAAARASALAGVLEGLRGAGIRQRLEGVNLFFNGFRYRSDRDLWGREDHWATPLEFLRKGAGDCEDFAIAKYFALRALGVPDAQLAVVYAFEGDRQSPHMVLLHGAPDSGDALVLDNRDGRVRAARDRADLLPVYALNAGPVRVAVRAGRVRHRYHPVQWRHRAWDRVQWQGWATQRMTLSPPRLASAPGGSASQVLARLPAPAIGPGGPRLLRTPTH